MTARYASGRGSGKEDGTEPGSRLRALPGVDALLRHAGDLIATHGRDRVVGAVRAELAQRRRQLRDGGAANVDPQDILERVAEQLGRTRPQAPQRVVNATGVVVHTNLGRAPLSDAAVAALVEAAGYCDLEYDLVTGERGSRGAAVDRLVAEVCGAEAATVTNNAASALVLVLAALAAGRGVLVSRGELVEIGGSFRLPDILAASGARLVEVGTTNRTRATDYRPPAGADDVALVLRMHPSNYRIVGFTEAPSVPELAAVARERGVPLVYDVGSGLPTARREPWARDEPSLAGALADGADLVIASGDKLLGGPQAGLVAGSRELVDACRRHPLARALRLDKLRIAALVATLEAHATGAAGDEVPVWRMLTADPAELRRRSDQLAAALPGAAVEDGTSVPGGGSAPGTGLSGPVVRLAAAHPDAVARRLRDGSPPVVVRVDAGVVVDLRTVDPADDELLVARLAACTSA